jgi:hypothetical protein
VVGVEVTTEADEALAGRIGRLERVARRDRTLALGVLALALTTAQAPSASPLIVGDPSGARATISARGLVVRDGTRTVRSDVGIDKDGYPSLDLYDTSGRIRQAMYLLNDRPVLRQFDKAGKRRAEMFLASDTSNGEFVIRDANDVTRAAVFQGDQGLPEIAFYGTDAKVRAYLSSDDASPYLVMKDRAGTSRIVMGGYQSGKMGMDVRDAAGAAVWSQP